MGAKAPNDHVILLELSRDPKELHDVLLTDPDSDLALCRALMTAHEFSYKLRRGAKAFIYPSQYEAAMEAIKLFSLEGFKLHSRHVLVSPELEDTVKNIIKSNKALKAQKVKVKNRAGQKIPLGFASRVAEESLPVVIRSTFINIDVPSSLRSASSVGLVTNTTGDMRPRVNPRVYYEAKSTPGS